MRIKYVRGVSRELEQEVSDEIGLSLIQAGMAVQEVLTSISSSQLLRQRRGSGYVLQK